MGLNTRQRLVAARVLLFKSDAKSLRFRAAGITIELFDKFKFQAGTFMIISGLLTASNFGGVSALVSGVVAMLGAVLLIAGLIFRTDAEHNFDMKARHGDSVLARHRELHYRWREIVASYPQTTYDGPRRVTTD